MNILSEIRNRPWIMLAVVGLALFAFLIDPSQLINYFRGGTDTVGEVAGKSIDFQEYRKMKGSISNQSRSRNLASENTIASQAWQELLYQKLTDRQIEELGLRISPNDIFKIAAPQFNFVNQDGTPDIDGFKRKLREWKIGAENRESQATGYWNQWVSREGLLREAVKRQKYLLLVASGLFVTDNQVDELISLEQDSVSLEYLNVNYTDIFAEQEFEISDEEIKEYIAENAKKYEREEGRTLDYVIFRSQPSEADINNIKAETEKFLSTSYERLNGEIVDTIPSFPDSKNDSAMVAGFSDRSIRWDYFSENEIRQIFSKKVSDYVLSAQEGSTAAEAIRTTTPRIGNEPGKDAFVLTKLNDIRPIIDSSKTSHILISYLGTAAAAQLSEITRSKEDAKALADSLYNIVSASPSRFSDFLKQSDDLGLLSSNPKTGELPWITSQSNGNPNFMNFALSNEAGEVGLIETPLGYHIVKIDKATRKKGYRVAQITKYIYPSEKTQNDIYKKSNSFIEVVSGKDRESFSKEANEKGYSFNSAQNVELFAQALPGLRTDKDAEILRWAFNDNTDIGGARQFTTSDGSYIVAYLAGKSEKGLASVASVKEQVTQILKREKATAYIQEKIKEKSSEQLAQELGVAWLSAGAGFNSSSNSKLNSEPKVLGSLAGMNKGETSAPIEGNSGVYIVKKLDVKSNEKPDANAIAQLKKGAQANAAQSVFGGLLQSLVDYFEPKDNRKRIMQLSADVGGGL